MADRRALEPPHYDDLFALHFRFSQQIQQMFASPTGSFFFHNTPANPPVNQRYNWILAEQDLIDGHIRLNDQSISRIPWEHQAGNHPPPPPREEESSTWYIGDEETIILESNGDYIPAPPNDGFSEETISDHIQTRTHHVSEDQETDICVVCQSEYEENENLGSLRCGHVYHAECIARWLSLRKFCPVCKRTA